MVHTELKNKVKEKIDSIDQSYLLEEILQLIDLETNSGETFIMPEAHTEELELSLKQLDEGKTFTNDFVNKRIAKWLLD
ncbi:MAG TPA: hypothetical protein DCX89_02375 [Saprospirales bacterium]|nr:hypothetical protein [Saprospirales bacterium]HAY70715.1 hypothetical protein [Saprospirales bacterium]HRQ28903.1 hypothetical protein [Saprospiraceae bacterium]